MSATNPAQNSWQQRGYCWIGGARYSRPLDDASAKKWRLMGELGITMFVVGFSTSPRPRCFVQHARFYLLPLLPVSALRHALLLVSAPVLLLWLIFRRDVQVLIAQSPYEGAAAAFARQIALLLGRRTVLIVESHGDFEESLFEYRRVRLTNVYRRLMHTSAHYTLRHSDMLRAVSDSTREQLEARAPGRPVFQFMAWTDADVFAQTERSVAPSQSPDLLFVGALAPVKGIHFLLDAFARIAARRPESRLLLVGAAANRDYAARLRAQVESYKLGARIRFTGAVSQAQLASIMARSRALVLPSTSEGLPRVILEAMLCGLPVVASRVGGIPELIQDGVNGYLAPPGDVEALVDALEKLFQPTVEATGQRAREFARSRCSNQAYIDNHVRMFQAADHLLRGGAAAAQTG